eukprot:TRINITY_DN2639_c0_g1_i2.p1 TRINITY_DN2639_c0_g1~~TRINITY_DN2639_c0_g1_i2.p1  ORF type:complete len:348 (+),score=113.35 TRINITY_DN2639_c0_g1_i2:151-1194(+)
MDNENAKIKEQTQLIHEQVGDFLTGIQEADIVGMTPMQKYKYISEQLAVASQLEKSITCLKALDKNISLVKAEIELNAAKQILRNHKDYLSPQEASDYHQTNTATIPFLERNRHTKELHYSSATTVKSSSVRRQVAHSRIGELELQNRSLEGKVNELNELIKEYWERIKAIQVSIQNKDLLIEKYKVENKSLRLEYEELFKAKESLRINSYSKTMTDELMEDSRASKREMELKQSSTLQELAKEKSENKMLHMEIVKLKNKEKLVNEKMKEQEDEMKRLSESHMSLKRDYEIIVSDNRKLKESNSELSEKLKKYKGKVAEQLNEINSLKAQVGIVQQEIVTFHVVKE